MQAKIEQENTTILLLIGFMRDFIGFVLKDHAEYLRKTLVWLNYPYSSF